MPKKQGKPAQHQLKLARKYRKLALKAANEYDLPKTQRYLGALYDTGIMNMEDVKLIWDKYISAAPKEISTEGQVQSSEAKE